MQRFFGSDDIGGNREDDDDLDDRRMSSDRRRRYSERAGSVTNNRPKNRHRQRLSARVRTLVAALPNVSTVARDGNRRLSIRSLRGVSEDIEDHSRARSDSGSFLSEDPESGDESATSSLRRERREDSADWKSVSTIDYSRRDPILLTDIDDDEPTFTYERPNGTRVRYRVESLVDYMLYAGTFREPETALPFSDDDLAELDRIAENAGMQKDSVLEASKRPEQFADRRFSSTAMVGLERCCGELIGEIPDIAESRESRESAQLYLMTELFPSIRYYFRQMYEFDPEFASQSLGQYREFVKGPPNRPVRDRNRVQAMSLQFLDDLERDFPPPPEPEEKDTSQGFPFSFLANLLDSMSHAEAVFEEIQTAQANASEDEDEI
eukprot:CAMPEP_0171500482 /NCGR_PEP_ID=MMETSP0958-20121227/9011_1 /TAXON_ID=87120 /ORGANISM="Aurantiochytrium limacinum, Strain ATCCMYA-1381" /LENGTH=379 /DNA_ID=CAMNT_0012035159 /DNA_START=642 /DNA_END=1782 /DNA_ORIENTATION=-